MDVLMPQLGETVSEGKIIKWFKAVGDHVAAGDNLCEIETDKVTVEVPAIEPGIIQSINIEVGTVAPVGAILAVLGNTAAPAAKAAAPVAKAAAPAPVAARPAAPSAAATPAVHAPAAQPPSAPRRGPLDMYREVDTPLRNFGSARLTGGTTVTPLARRLASDGGIDLARLSGSGPRGRILGKDVTAAIATRPAAPSPAMPAESPVGAIYRDRPHTVLPIDGMRRTIARRLVEAKTTIPHFYLSADIVVDRLSRLREEINAAAPKKSDGTPAYRLTLTDLMVKALALALQHVPRANAIWSADGILTFQHSDVAVAVSVPDGLFTPVIQSAEGKALSAISAEVKDLAARARAKALQPHEYQGGVTTISNLGMHGVRDFAAIVNPPQSTILAVGAARRDAIETETGGVTFAGRITATLSCDHRVVDGIVAAELLASFKHMLENPLQMIA